MVEGSATDSASIRSPRATQYTPDEWIEHCERSVARRTFVIPFLKQLVDQHKPRSIIDVGCGPGWLAAHLIPAAASDVTWRLLDRDASMLAECSKRCSHLGRVEIIEADVTDEYSLRHIEPADLVFIALSSLEFHINEAVANAIVGLVTPGGVLLLILPDTLTDVRAELRRDPTSEYLDAYIAGTVTIAKCHSPSLAYDLYVTRNEVLLGNFLLAGTRLEMLHRQHVKAGSAEQCYFAFLLRKP